MNKIKFMTVIMAVLIVFTSCGTNQKTGTLVGGGGGAALGALVGTLIGGNATGAIIGTAVGAAVGGTAGNLIGKKMDKVKAEAQAKLQNAQVETVTDANGLEAVKVTFDSGILFATGKADLNANSKNELARFATVLKNNSDCSVDVKGYTDSTGNDGINLPLSQNRAQAVSSYLSSCGVSSSQFKNVNGYGSSNPVADNSTAEGRQQNRRVEVYLYASQEMINKANAGTLN